MSIYGRQFRTLLINNYCNISCFYIKIMGLFFNLWMFFIDKQLK